MDIISKSLIWRLLGWLPGFILRMIFTEKYLENHTEIDVRARGEQVTFYSRGLAHVSVWLAIRNRGHFTIELDRLTLEISLSTKFCDLFYLHREKIKLGDSKDFLIEGLLSERHIETLSHLKDKSICSIRVKAYFNNKIHNFKIDTKSLQGVQIEVR